MKTVVLEDVQGSTLANIAANVKVICSWRDYKVDEGNERIFFTDDVGRTFNLYTDGLAFEVVNGEEKTDPDERWTLDFRDVLSWRDLIWAKDANGFPLAIHG